MNVPLPGSGPGNVHLRARRPPCPPGRHHRRRRRGGRTSTSAVVALLEAMCERNGVDHDDIISILFTATDDIHSTFPAAGARKIGLGDVPLICARELDV